MRRLALTTLRSRLRIWLAGASLLLLVPAVTASLHLGQVMELNRRLSQREAAEATADPAARGPLRREIRELRRAMAGGGDRAFRDVIGLTALSLVLLVTVTLVVPGRLLQPVQRLKNLIRQAEGGNLRVLVDRVDQDEIGQLTTRLYRLLQELERFDELKRAKVSALAAQRNQLLDLLPTPAILLDGEGRFLVASTSARQLFDLQEAALLERPLLVALGWQETALAALLVGTEHVAEDTVELQGRTFRAQALRGPGDSVHRLLLFHQAPRQGR